MVANNTGPDQMPHHVASDMGLHCLPMILLQATRQNGLSVQTFRTFTENRLHRR